MIHKDNVIFDVLTEFQCSLTAVCTVNLNLGIFQKSLYNGKIHGIVIDNKNLCIRCYESCSVFLDLFIAVCIFLTESADRLTISDALLQSEGEGRSDAILTADVQAGVHQLKQFLCNTDTKTGTFDIPVSLFFNTFKGYKQLVDILRLNTDTGICHGNDQLDCRIACFFPVYL